MADQENEVKSDSLPPPYQAAVENGLTRYHQIVAERDAYELETRELRTQLAGYKVAMEANDTRLLDQESQVQTMRLERDQAVANLSVYEAFFRAQQVMMNEFVPPRKSLADQLKDKDDETRLRKEIIPQAVYTNTPYRGHDVIDDRSQFRMPNTERST